MQDPSRRKFIKRSMFVTAGSMLIPSFLKAYETQLMGKSPDNDRVLVIIQLSGGNDGLNTVIPYRNDLYYKARPTIAVDKSKVLPIADEIGFNPAFSSMKQLYDEGLLTIINGIGYPNPDRSHFRSMDIWHTASNADQYVETGWIGRYLDATCAGSDCLHPYDAIEVDDTLSLSMKGSRVKGLAVSNPQKLYQQTRDPYLNSVAIAQPADDHENVAYLYKTLRETVSSSEYIYDKAKIYRTKAIYPQTELGEKLKTVAQMIVSRVGANVFYVSLSGFDTHVAQNVQQSRLLKMYADALQIFTQDLKQNNCLNNTLVMTFSEFGRRVKQNASNGTDHGTANNLFLTGGNLKNPGVYNPLPDLQHLDNGDLKFSIDFRRVYATLLEKWLQADPAQILSSRFEPLAIV